MSDVPGNCPPKDYTLLTGCTGMLGSYLLRDLLSRGHRLAVVVRPQKRAGGRTRVETILCRFEIQSGECLARPIVFQGDVTKPDLGLRPADLAWVKKRCRCMIHSAASVKFSGSTKDGDPWKTNVEGTHHVLKFCKSADIRQLHYISTAYVCGIRNSLVLEDELETGQEFRNNYERTKFEAEKLVRGDRFLRHATIYRPAVIVGDSKTGYTSTYHGLHLHLRLMSILIPRIEQDEKGVRTTPIRLPIRGDEKRNFVPVNWVSRVICDIYENPDAHGNTYHLVPDEPTTPQQVIESCCRYFNTTGVEYVGDCNISDNAASSFEREYLNGVSLYDAYDRTDPTFCNANLKRFAGHLPCPAISEATIHRYIAYGETDKWGKCRQHSNETGVVFDDLSPQVCRLFSQFVNSLFCERVKEGLIGQPCDLVVGLNIVGPGGGQWTLFANPVTGTGIQQGLPPVQFPIFQFTIKQISALLKSKVLLRNGGVTSPTWTSSRVNLPSMRKSTTDLPRKYRYST